MEKVATYIPAAQYKGCGALSINKIHNTVIPWALQYQKLVHTMCKQSKNANNHLPKVHDTSKESEITPSGCLHVG